jgi:hypothetical protein
LLAYSTLHISILRSLYFKIFSASFLITFLFPGIAKSINMQVFFLSWIMMSSLLGYSRDYSKTNYLFLLLLNVKHS